MQKRTYEELYDKLTELDSIDGHDFADELELTCKNYDKSQSEKFFGNVVKVQDGQYTNEIDSQIVWHFKDHDIYMAINGTWYSYDGMTWDDVAHQVWPHAISGINYLKTPTKELTFDEFLIASKGLSIKIGRINSVVRIPNSSKLLDLEVSFGDHTRHVVTNIGGQIQDEQILIDRKFQFIMNLLPVTMMGVKSEAMILLPTRNDEVLLDFEEGATVLG